MRQSIHTSNAPQPKGPYSQAIVAQGRQIYVSSQGGYDPATGKLVSEDFKEQARQIFANLQAILAASGATLADVVKVTVLLADYGNFAALTEVYQQVFPLPYPVRTTCQVVLSGGALLAVDCIAVVED